MNENAAQQIYDNWYNDGYEDGKAEGYKQGVKEGRTRLTFERLREANKERLNGDFAHSERDGSDWIPAQWLQALVGEVGEFANLRKKFERGDIDAHEYRAAAGDELADIQCYLDLLALRCLDTPGKPHPHGINLAHATTSKFNRVSQRIGSKTLLVEGVDYEDY